MPTKNNNIEDNTHEEENYVIGPDDSIDVKRLTFKPTKRGDGAQDICYPKYYYGNDPTPENIKNASTPLTIITEPIKIIRGGIPGYNDKTKGYFPNGEKSTDRAHMHIYLDEEQESCKKLFKQLKTIDKYMKKKINDEKNEDGILSYNDDDGNLEPFDEITYQNLITQNQKPKKYKKGDPFTKYDRVKAKFSQLYEKDVDRNARKLNTAIFLNGEDEPLEIDNITEYEEYIKYGGTYSFALQISKAYIMSSGDMKCGVTLKISQINVEELPSKKSAASSFKKNLFGKKKSSNKEDDEVIETKAKDEDEDEEESDDDEEESSDDSSDDEDDSDDEDEDTKKTSKKSKKKSN